MKRYAKIAKKLLETQSLVLPYDPTESIKFKDPFELKMGPMLDIQKGKTFSLNRHRERIHLRRRARENIPRQINEIKQQALHEPLSVYPFLQNEESKYIFRLTLQEEKNRNAVLLINEVKKVS